MVRKFWLDYTRGPAASKPMLVIGYGTVLRRWENKQPKYKTEQPLPDPELLNSAIPVAEWELDLTGNPRPPWAYCYVIYMVNPVTGTVYTFAHDTYGTLLCYQALEESCAVMRLLRSANVLPIVQLGKAPWKSARWGMQMRPHLEIIEWREPPGGNGGGNLVQQIPAPRLSGPAPAAAAPTPAQDETMPWEDSPAPSTPTSPPTAAPKLAPAYPPAAQSAAAAAAKAAAAQSPLLAKTKPVKPITIAESIADELPPHSAPPKDDKGWR